MSYTRHSIGRRSKIRHPIENRIFLHTSNLDRTLSVTFRGNLQRNLQETTCLFSYTNERTHQYFAVAFRRYALWMHIVFIGEKRII